MHPEKNQARLLEQSGSISLEYVVVGALVS
jgi:hypothetical protein